MRRARRESADAQGELLQLDDVRSSFFDDPAHFSAGVAVPDSAFLMAGVPTSWRARPAMTSSQEPRPARS